MDQPSQIILSPVFQPSVDAFARLDDQQPDTKSNFPKNLLCSHLMLKKAECRCIELAHLQIGQSLLYSLPQYIFVPVRRW